MLARTTLLAAITLGIAAPAGAATITTLPAAFAAGTAQLPVAATTTYPGFDPTALIVTAPSIPVAGGTLGLSTPTQVVQGANTTYGQFPYALTDGFTGELFVPVDANGNNVSSETITLSNGLSALAFEVAPYGAAVGQPNFGVPGGPYTVTVAVAGGPTQTVSLPGGDFNTGTTPAQFFGIYGGGFTTLTISTSDRSGFAFGNLQTVPEPASAALLLAAVTALAALSRRTRT